MFFRPAPSHGGNSSKLYTSLCQPSFFIPLLHGKMFNQMEVEHMKELLRKSPTENRGRPGGQEKMCSLLPVNA